MKEYIIGLNLPGSTNLTSLDSELTRIENDGYQACEINLSTVPLIIGGKAQQQVIDHVKGILSRHSLRYTAHAGYGLDLRKLEEHDLHRAALFSSIDVCAALNLNPLNLHYEMRSNYPAREEAFLKAHLEAAEYAQERGVSLNIENIEVEYASRAADFVRTLNHPNVGMTLDLGHLYLSACYYGYDFMDAVEDCIPLLRHIHINDNTGDFEPLRLTNYELYNTLDRGYRIAFGRGDIHIPPFWGKAPIKEALSAIKKSGYSGIWMCEYYSQYYHPFNKSVQESVRNEIEKA